MKWNDYRRKNRKYVTNGAFAECIGEGFVPIEGYKPTWTLEDEDHDGLYSFKKWFLKFYRDPTETRFVDECFEGDLKHWENFKSSRLIKPVYENIKAEAEQRLLRDVMCKIVETAMDDNNKSQMVALKYLADRGGKLTGVGRGRPKKADIDKAAREIAEEDKATADDLKRILG
jgi:hypothetical protein